MKRFLRIILMISVITIVVVAKTPEKNLMNQEIITQALATEQTEFEWFPNRPGITRAQIALGRAVTLKFEFRLKGQDASKVLLGIPKRFADMGIFISPKEVSVKDGVAKSMAIFSIPPGTPLGKFELTIVTVDAKTKKELGRGEIPFMLLPARVGGC